MDPTPPSSLDDAALAVRLVALTGEARQVLVDFLLHLDEFDRRRAYLQAGYDSLWTWCHGVLHLREGPAGRRIAAMRVLRRFPSLEAPLRDGRLCLTTVTVLGPVLTTDNVEQLVAQAAFRTKVETEELVAVLQPRPPPQEGVRRIACPVQAVALALADGVPARVDRAVAGLRVHSHGVAQRLAVSPAGAADPAPFREQVPDGDPVAEGADAGARGRASGFARRRVIIEPLAQGRWSMRVTLDAAMKADLELLASLASHALGRDLAAVLHEAIRCGIEKLGKRRGAVDPSRKVARRQPVDGAPGHRVAIPAEVRRQVWRRDGGRCAWVGHDGRRCESRHKLEFHHVVAVARGGTSTIDNVRLLCRPHNALHAEETFGRAHMARTRGGQLAFR